MSSKDDLKGLAAREQASSIKATKATSARATTGPRAPKYATKVDNFLRLLSEGHSIEAAAVGAELVRQTVYGWMDKHEYWDKARIVKKGDVEEKDGFAEYEDSRKMYFKDLNHY